MMKLFEFNYYLPDLEIDRKIPVLKKGHILGMTM
jgi:hypothetical protein